MTAGLVLTFTRGGTTSFKTFYAEHNGKKLFGDEKLSLVPGEELRFDVKYTFDALVDEEEKDYSVSIITYGTKDNQFTYTANGQPYGFDATTEVDISDYFNLKKEEDHFTMELPNNFSMAAVLSQVHEGKTIEVAKSVDISAGWYFAMKIQSYKGSGIDEVPITSICRKVLDVLDEKLFIDAIQNEALLLQFFFNFFPIFIVETTENHPKIDPITIIDNSGFIYMVAVYQRIMKFAKNNSFVDEDEVRLYFETEAIPETTRIIKSMEIDLADEVDIDHEQNFRDLVKDLKIKQEQYMKSQAGIRSYHNLCLEKIWGSGLVPEIILGPMCAQNRKELERFLRSNGLGDTKVSVSKVPIR